MYFSGSIRRVILRFRYCRAAFVLESNHVRDAGAEPGIPAGGPVARKLPRNGKVKTRTLANLSRWPERKVDKLQRALKGLPAARDLSEAFEITRSLPHGHVAAVLGTARRLGIEELIDATPSRRRDLVCAMLIAAGDRPGLQAGHRARAAHRHRHQLPGCGAGRVGL